MAEFYDEDWYCATHDHKWNRANDEHTTPRHCPKSQAWLEDDEPERCEITTIGEHREAMAIPEPEDRERSTFWDGR